MNNDNLHTKKDFDNLASLAKEKVQDTAQNLTDGVKNTSQSLKETTSALKNQLTDKASEFKDKFTESCCNNSEKAVQCLKDKPIHSAIGFSILGFLLGLHINKRKNE